MQTHSKILLSRVAIWVLGQVQEEKEDQKEQRCKVEPDITWIWGHAGIQVFYLGIMEKYLDVYIWTTEIIPLIVFFKCLNKKSTFGMVRIVNWILKSFELKKVLLLLLCESHSVGSLLVYYTPMQSKATAVYTFMVIMSVFSFIIVFMHFILCMKGGFLLIVY